MNRFTCARSRVNAWTTRIPAMSSASVAVTSPSRSRTCRYASAECLRKSAVAITSSGRIVIEASASRQSRKKRITAVPKSVNVFCTSEVTPSVTSWSSASTSFVRRLMITPARFRSKKPRDSRCRWRKMWLRMSASIRSPVQPVKYVCADDVAIVPIPARMNSATMLHSAPALWRRMPWSIASFARYGGASEIAVARSRKKIAAAVRPLYGAVRRVSVEMRRTVARQDQSSTFAPRSRIMCPPGWWTLTPSPALPRVDADAPPVGETLFPPRAPFSSTAPFARSTKRETSRFPAPFPTRGRAGSRRRLHARRELLLEQPVLVDLAVDVARLEQLVVRAAGGDRALVEHDDLVGERDRREAMRDDDRRPAAHHLAQSGFDLRLRRRVD